MKPSMIAGGVATAVVLMLAGCTGNFEVQQTEPFKVQIDGEPQTVTVREGDSTAKEVVVNPCGEDEDEVRTCDVEQVDVKVEIQSVSAGPCMVRVTIKDKETGEVLEERDIDVGGNGSASQTTTDGGGTTTTVTTTETQTVDGSSQVVVQNFFIDVKGKDNIVVLTQAIQGEANVDISAADASGNADASVDDDEDDDSMGTSSTTTGYP